MGRVYNNDAPPLCDEITEAGRQRSTGAEEASELAAAICGLCVWESKCCENQVGRIYM